MTSYQCSTVTLGLAGTIVKLIAIKVHKDKVNRYQNKILGTSGNRRSTQYGSNQLARHMYNFLLVFYSHCVGVTIVEL